MYTIKVSYGDGYYYDEPEMATTEILGTYESRDEAREAAADKFGDIMERLGDDLEVHFHALEASLDLDNYYVIYGYLNQELGYVDNEHYYMVSVIER